MHTIKSIIINPKSNIINTPHTLSILLNQFSRLQSQLTQQQSHNHTLQSQVNLLNNPNLTEEQIQIEEQLASTINNQFLEDIPTPTYNNHTQQTIDILDPTPTTR